TAYPASAAPLQPGDEIRLQERDFSVGGMVEDLFFWNGIDPVTFAPAAADFRIDGTNPLGTAGPGGAFHDHPFLAVDSDALPGIYLASVFGTVDGFNPSDPVYLVMGTEDLITADFLGITQEEFDLLTEEDIEEALDAVIDPAMDWVETNLVPEPGSVSLALLACCGAIFVDCKRRRQHNR
ncbi:MAG: hypothetical protein L0Z07_02595, partial [Planctomycetes bacterium]|nr:hypothetical protein [Planctomycetota bacterium]